MFRKKKINKILSSKKMTLFGDNLNIKNIQKNNVIKNTWSFKE